MIPADGKQGTQAQAALLARAVAGDRGAAGKLARDLGARAYAQAFRMLGNHAEAEDVAQDALLRLWRVAPRWDAQGGGQPSSWLYRVVANLCLDRMRRGHGPVAEAVEVRDLPDPQPGAEASLLQVARRELLHAALRRLPDRQRQAVVLRHIEGLGNPEIASIMNIGVEAVESLTARGKRALVQALAGHRAELGFLDDDE